MCGIFGLKLKINEHFSSSKFRHDSKLLFKISKKRGQDSAGIVLSYQDKIDVFQKAILPKEFIRSKAFDKLFLENEKYHHGQELSMMGHCRLVVNGSVANEANNQPIVSKNVIGIHNGIILNAEELYQPSPGPERLSKSKESSHIISDSKLYFDHLSLRMASQSFSSATVESFSKIRGSASLAMLAPSGNEIILATNTGSLYYFEDKESEAIAFASERAFLVEFLKKSSLLKGAVQIQVEKLKVNSALLINSKGAHLFSLSEKEDNVLDDHKNQKAGVSRIHIVRSSVKNLKRCSKCILPSTYPFIYFDEKGVCNFCLKYKKQVEKGKEALSKVFDLHRSKTGDVDCLIGLSGGRDSCYGLHVIKEEFGMNPIAYTYDWGLTTDISRRNQALMCGELGVEHIIRSADIPRKRRYVRKNIHAWLKRPDLGMVPIFMAGDKDFYHFGRQLRKETGLGFTVFAAGQQVEQREFMIGFCGVVEKDIQNNKRLYEYKLLTKMKLAFYYVSQYARNPYYINESLKDSIRSFFTSFIGKDDFIYLYEYLLWDEKKINKVLEKEYQWEADKKYGENQWRMGDGQTAFTNYIYYTLAGFSEFDNFRANQVREDLITRDDALKLAELDNIPKIETLEYFASVVGINLEETLSLINNIPKLY